MITTENEPSHDLGVGNGSPYSASFFPFSGVDSLWCSNV